MDIQLDDIHGLRQSWAKAVVAQDVEALMKLYADNAVLKPTLSPVIRRNPTVIRAYFEGGGPHEDAGFLKQGFSAVHFKDSAPLLMGDIAVDMGEYEFLKPDGSQVLAHYTFCYQGRVDGQILIVAQHSSLKMG
jgi:hypothetical protein